ncbi:universal stress protein [Paracoccus sp. PARArs4]|uniref:universal stress protein n=1 Tax=Paracoccus sp. PARArs4 TaxID=2853442 RepID=UPI0024A6A83F|nr:universal stress protein [Paracoccus sp. PARArs4]
MNRILALVDGSAYSESVCHHSAWIAGRLATGVDLMHVLGRREGAEASDLSGSLRLGARSALLAELAEADATRARIAQARGRAILEDAEGILRADNVGPVATQLRKGDLVEAVTELEPDLRAIVIGKRGEGADFATGHLGSNLERVVRATRIPVFVASRAFNPIERVLVAFDGSASARTAIRRMADSPVFAGLAVTLLHVGEDKPAMRDKLDEAAMTLAGAGLRPDIRINAGEPDEVIDRVVTEDGFDLLVMGAYGHSRIRSLIIGSTTTAMVRAVRIPVLLYR